MELRTGVSVFACGADYTQPSVTRASVHGMNAPPERLGPWRKLGIEYTICGARHLCHLDDIVDADDVRAVEDARGHRCGRSPDTLFRRCGLAATSQSRAKEALARCAYEQWKTELRQLRQLKQDFVVLREALAEADAGVEDDLRFRDTGFERHSDGTAKALQDVLHHVPCEWPFLHRARLASHVHQDQRDAMTCGDFGNARIAFQSGDVIDDFRAGVERGLRDLGLLRVNGDGDFQKSAQAAEHGEESSPFFFC